MIYTSYTFNTSFMADMENSLNLDNIQESTILAIYDDIMDLADFDTRYHWVFHFAFDDAIFKNWSRFDDDWHLNIFLILPILSISSFFSVAHDMMISIIFLQLMMWPYSALGLIILLLMTHRPINAFMTISSYSAFLCV